MSGQSTHPELAEAQRLWRPPKRRYDDRIHELLDGALRSGESRLSEYGPYPSVVAELPAGRALTMIELGDKDGKPELRQLGRRDAVRVAVLGEVSRRDLANAQPELGNHLKVAYYGKLGDEYTSRGIWRARPAGGRFDAAALFGRPDTPANIEGLAADADEDEGDPRV
jgi:hypothetical protein